MNLRTGGRAGSVGGRSRRSPEAGAGDTDSGSPTCASGATCDPHATCTDTPDGFRCTCNQGYSGDGKTCTDTDECTPPNVNDCAKDGAATCTNTPGSYTCACREGYAGDGKSCDDINECAPGFPNECAPDGLSTCTNTDGSYTCACKTGYTGDGKSCTDIDECAGVNKCPAGKACVNTPGSYTCDCGAGFRWTGSSCADIDECTTGANDCAPVGSVCTNTSGSFTCACAKGYTGDGRMCTDTSVQIDVSALFDKDTVLNYTGGAFDPIQDPIDGTGYEMVTQTAANQLRPGSTNNGLPDDALFAADNNHPRVKLGWNNADNGFNSRIVKTNESFTITCQHGRIPASRSTPSRPRTLPR